ncbi:hypothetical protein CEXT_615701, partial [Caerostris extrusa]
MKTSKNSIRHLDYRYIIIVNESSFQTAVTAVNIANGFSCTPTALDMIDLEHMPEDADSDHPVGMRPSLSPPPLNAPLPPSKGPLLPLRRGGPLANGSSSPRPPLASMGPRPEKPRRGEDPRVPAAQRHRRHLSGPVGARAPSKETRRAPQNPRPSL